MQGFSLREPYPPLFHPVTATAQRANPNAAWSGPRQPDRCPATQAFPMRRDDNRATRQRTRTAYPLAGTAPGEPRVFYLTARARTVFDVPAGGAMAADCGSPVSTRTQPQRPAHQCVPWYCNPASHTPNSYEARIDRSDSGDDLRNACGRTPRISGRPRRMWD